MIRLPLTVVRLLPRRWAAAYADNLRHELGEIELKRAHIEALLEVIEPGYEYTLGFREHLRHRWEDGQLERFALARHLGDVEFVLYPSN